MYAQGRPGRAQPSAKPRPEIASIRSVLICQWKAYACEPLPELHRAFFNVKRRAILRSLGVCPCFPPLEPAPDGKSRRSPFASVLSAPNPSAASGNDLCKSGQNGAVRAVSAPRGSAFGRRRKFPAGHKKNPPALRFCSDGRVGRVPGGTRRMRRRFRYSGRWLRRSPTAPPGWISANWPA